MQAQEAPHPYETKAAQRWEKAHYRNRHMLPRWRSPEKQRTLVKLHSISLVCYAIVTVLFPFNSKAALLWVPAAVFGMIVWTMLRITINAKDSAPPEVLDEYELEVLNDWRRRAFSYYSAGLVVICSALIIVGTTLMSQDSPNSLLGLEPGEWMYFLGLATLTFSLACSTLPAVGYARAFTAHYPEENY